MRPSPHNAQPAGGGFAVEEFDGQTLILRLRDMRLFRVNARALDLFRAMCAENGQADAAAEKLKKEGKDADAEEIRGVWAHLTD